MEKKFVSIMLLASMLLTLTGCFGTSVDELYSLPKASDEYIQLEQLIKLETTSGFEYSAPTSGNFRQPVLLYDLDGDKTDEALVFLRGAEQLLKICIYSTSGGDYSLICTIEGEGTAVRRIEFSDLDGDGMVEVIVSWQISAEMRMLKAYSMAAWNATEILAVTDCTEFRVSDIDGDGGDNLIALHFSAADGGSIEVFILSADGELQPITAKLSPGLTSVERMRASGYIQENVPVILVEGMFEDGRTLTDAFVCKGDRLVNLTADSETGISSAIRDHAVYSSDIDNDRYMEIPYTERLYSQTEGMQGYLAYDWYSFDEDGNRVLDVSTYHCNSDGWFLTLPASWRENLTVRREDSVSGERVVVISYYDPLDDDVVDLLVIYYLTGDNRRERAKLSGRFTLIETDSAIYAGKILYAGDGNVPVFAQDSIKLNLIHTEWNPGSI